MRLEITRRADLAVRALVVLGAERDADALRRVKGADLAAAIGTTTAFLPQILAPLVRAGWVRSDPGPRGGYLSEVSLRAISVLEVIEAVDGATDDGRCVVADRACRAVAPCLLHGAWRQARGELTRQLDALSLAELGPGGSAPV